MYNLQDLDNNNIPDIYENNDLLPDSTAVYNFYDLKSDYDLLNVSVATSDVAIKENYQSYIAYKTYTLSFVSCCVVSIFAITAFIFKLGGK